MDRTRKAVLVGVRILIRCALMPCVVSALLAGAVAAQPFDILPEDKIVAGMKGYGVTDMGDGRGIQRFDVEILGLLRKFAPGQDLILARVGGIGLEKAGVIAGMSGSPIYVEGKLVGALAYGWPFSKDPICGITPIQSMLDIRHAPPAPPVPISGAAVSTASFLSAFAGGGFSERFEELLKPFRGSVPDSMAALPLPVSFGGRLGPGRLLSRIAEAANWMTVPSGSGTPSSPTAAEAPPAVPAAPPRRCRPPPARLPEQSRPGPATSRPQEASPASAPPAGSRRRAGAAVPRSSARPRRSRAPAPRRGRARGRRRARGARSSGRRGSARGRRRRRRGRLGARRGAPPRAPPRGRRRRRSVPAPGRAEAPRVRGTARCGRCARRGRARCR